MKILKSQECDITREIEKLKQGMSIFADTVTKGMEAKTKEVFGEPLSPAESVKRVINDVKEKGDEALEYYSEKFEGVSLSAENIKIKTSEIEEAYNKVSPELISAIKNAKENIREFQEHIRIREPGSFHSKGAKIEVKYSAIENVGIYVPGGAASYPSSVLMNAIPAKVAGVDKIVVVTPPGRDGAISPERLVACGEADVDEVYMIGGVHAIAALTFGTKTVPGVDKIVGPGNQFVTLAKREAYGHVGIDMLAGPSEVLIVADESANHAYVASDLLSQAEHAPGISILVTSSEEVANGVLQEVSRQTGTSARSSLIEESLDKFGFIVITENMNEAIDISNTLAPEHLLVIVKNEDEVLSKLKHAGAIFAGPYTPVAVGDYYAGPSHVLPTSSTARFCSGLSVNDFLKRTSIMSYSEEVLKSASNDIITIAESEGLHAHANSVRIRVNK
ncbi:histidinol dehydrogenase [Candidatus Scalindua japonica]|uniref:Histidinol dehydrogenase n=1 Tax=Candidatus Scalindua japonica TaxID=1284222 RepID=A0A286U380_9BACT|nr:histidinol dehydrogenase [Candidatus Scalindua japonica]GAX62589.1 histidinol dehydrogenase [Candidatus Scalindua japonica]